MNDPVEFWERGEVPQKRRTVSISLTPDQWRWVHGVLDGQLDAGACKGGNYVEETEALHAATRKIMRAVKTLTFDNPTKTEQ